MPATAPNSPNTSIARIETISRVARCRRRFLIIHNPLAGRQRRALYHDVLDHLAAEGCSIDIRETMSREDAQRLALLGCTRDYEAIVVCGGDGTINEVVNGLSTQAPPLGVIPIGTANVLALELGLGFDAAKIAGSLLRAPEREVFLGLVNGRRFMMMAGVGLDARVVAGLSRRTKRRLGKAAYVLRATSEIMGRRLPDYEVLVDGVRYRAASVVVAKGRYYGGSFVCAPDAQLSRPSFEVCLFHSTGRLNAIKYAAAMMVGQLPKLADVTIVTGREVRVPEPIGEPVQADGDVVTAVPVVMAIESRSLRLIGPLAAP